MNSTPPSFQQPTAEGLYRTLLTQHTEVMAPKLLEYVAASADNLQMREAVYNCVGVGMRREKRVGWGEEKEGLVLFWLLRLDLHGFILHS